MSHLMTSTLILLMIEASHFEKLWRSSHSKSPEVPTLLAWPWSFFYCHERLPPITVANRRHLAVWGGLTPNHATKQFQVCKISQAKNLYLGGARIAPNYRLHNRKNSSFKLTIVVYSPEVDRSATLSISCTSCTMTNNSTKFIDVLNRDVVIMGNIIDPEVMMSAFSSTKISYGIYSV